ncbi:hypothetical protein [Nocardiopsis listeri]|uniref:hypothetical protein n=1 Tax=Nocardiopsis listeri TaxID=53440 RepID=UPI0008336207|nr:hypothetical protein [Nocardiopsis listeri]
MVNIRNFRHTCYTVARLTGGKVVGFRIANGVIPNFHQGLIGYHDRTVAVACTRDSAILAVAEPPITDFATGFVESGPLMFVDAPALTAALAKTSGFQVLTPAELNGPFDAAAWPEVLASDIEYWRPESLGEALFNYWD